MPRLDSMMNRQTVCCMIVGIALAGGCARFQSKPLAPVQTAADFDARSLNDAGLHQFIATNLHHEVTTWDFPALTLAALYFHPDLDVTRAQWSVAKAGQVKAGERPNPTVGVAPGFDTTTSMPSPWIASVNFDIPIETAGKRGYRLAQAKHLSEAARLSIAAVAWQVRSRVRSRWLDLFAATRAEALSRQQQTAQEQVVKLLQAQLDAGAVSPFEVTQARIAWRTASLSVNEAQRQLAEARVALADALGVPARALDRVAVSFASLEKIPAMPAADARRVALTSRADILGALAEYAASQSALQLEIAKQYPDVHLNPGYQFDQGDDKWTVGLSVELPLLNQNQGGVAEARAKREEAAAKFMALQARVIGEIDRTLAGYEAARRKAATAAALLADQQKQRETARRMFEAGETSRLALATAEAEMLTTELSRLDALVKVQQAFGALEDALQNAPPSAALTEESSRTPAATPVAGLPQLIQTIPLLHVKGGFDLMAIDLAGRRLFLNAEDNNTTEVIDLAAGRLAHTITDGTEPKWVVYRPELRRLYIANGTGAVRVYDSETFAFQRAIQFREKANNLRFDPQTRELFVGVGKTFGAIGVVDTRKDSITAEIPLANFPKQFELDGNRIYVNVPEANHVAVIDRKLKKVVATWPVAAAKDNVPMALDRASHRLFVGCEPGKLAVLDTVTGQPVATVDIAPEPDGIYFDAKRRQLYVSCGDGSLDVIRQKDADHYEPAGRVPTAKGAATSLFVPELERLFLAVPQRDGQTAELRVYSTTP